MSTFLERLTAIVDDYGQPAELGATPEDYMPSTRAQCERATGMSMDELSSQAVRVATWVAQEAAASGRPLRVSDIAGLWALGVVAGAEASFDG
jgi:hypothetical protein